MKKIAIGFLTVMLSVTPCVHAQQIADVLAKNEGGMLPSLAEGTFNADCPTFIPQNFIYHTGEQTHPINIWVYQDDLGSSWIEAGQNNIFQGSGSATLIQGYSFSNTSVDIDSNYWGGFTPPVIAPPSATNWPNFNFTAPHGAISFTPLPDLSCSSDQDDMVKKGGSKIKPLSILDADSCNEAINAAYGWDQNTTNACGAYDTMKWYITNCYPIADAGSAWGGLGEAFDSVNQTQAGRQAAFNFVIYGLGLRSDDDWFCTGVPLLGVEFNSGFEGETPNYRADRAIYQYLMNNPRCAGDINDSVEYGNLLATQWNLWADSSAPGSTFDSSVPTLHDLGLDTLLAINAKDGVTFALPTPAIINSASITENPFDNSTSIYLSIGREAYLTIAVYNVLGQQIAGAGYAGVFEQGSATVGINMSSAPPGAYLVRISTANNEVQTLKLTKE